LQRSALVLYVSSLS